ncbi:TPA: hypothetical protein DCX15_00590 [bacterium]|nr:hypothetical protein [bacterium]
MIRVVRYRSLGLNLNHGILMISISKVRPHSFILIVFYSDNNYRVLTDAFILQRFIFHYFWRRAEKGLRRLKTSLIWGLI